MTRRLLLALLLFAATPAWAQTVAISDPVTAKAGQIIPPANGVTNAGSAVFAGTYTGTAPSNIDIQIYRTDGTTIVQAWTALASPTIAGGNWSGTVSVPFELYMMKAQARETSAPSVVSSVTANTFGAGPTVLLIGQSNIANFWHVSTQTTIGTTTLNSTTVGLPNASPFQAFPLDTYLTGQPITGPNLPGGTTISGTYNSAGNPETFVVSQQATATASGTATLNLMLTPPAADAMAFRFNKGAVFGVGLVSQAGEWDAGIIANGEGANTLANLLSEQFGAGSMLLEQAQGSTQVSDWISPSGTDYAQAHTALLQLNAGFDRVYWNQGENDADLGTAQATYLTGLRNVEAWTRLFRANAPFFITPLGRRPTGAEPDANWDAIRQAHLQAIDNDANVFYGGGELDLPHSGDVHLDPNGRITLARRIVQAMLRQAGLSTSGYGPVIASAFWDGNVTVTVTVTQEGAATLTCGALSTSCSAITGFLVFGNGSPATISSTALTQPNKIVLTLGSAPASPVTLNYQYGRNPVTTNAVCDNQAPFGDARGLPLQPSRGLVTASTNVVVAQPIGGVIQ